MINYCDKILRIYHYFKWYNIIKVVQYQTPKCYQKKHLNCDFASVYSMIEVETKIKPNPKITRVAHET